MRSGCSVFVLVFIAVAVVTEPAEPAIGQDLLAEFDTEGARLGFIELQAGGRVASHRLLLAVPAIPGVQTPLMDLLLRRELHRVCLDRTALGQGGLSSRAWRRNMTLALPAAQPEATPQSTCWSQPPRPRLRTRRSRWRRLRSNPPDCILRSTQYMAVQACTPTSLRH